MQIQTTVYFPHVTYLVCISIYI